MAADVDRNADGDDGRNDFFAYSGERFRWDWLWSLAVDRPALLDEWGLRVDDAARVRLGNRKPPALLRAVFLTG